VKLRLWAVLSAGLVLVGACGRLNTPEKKAGYAVGLSIGQSLKSIEGKVDLDQVGAGLSDELESKSRMSMEEMQNLLRDLAQGQVGDQARTGYAVGCSIGKNIRNIVALVDVSSLKTGIKDQLKGKPAMSEELMRTTLGELTERQRAESQKSRAAQGEKNKAEGQAYLEKNKTKPGVKVTASGLQYEVLKGATGPKPKATDTVRVHYTGTLIDGTVFDSSVQRGQPAEFPLNGVIAGWTEGLQLMPVGSKYRFTIPSELAYGENGAGSQIGPNAVLIFEVELLAIVKK
jgi:FKBP-type peptidyl-prolyl cis-trans isomerase